MNRYFSNKHAAFFLLPFLYFSIDCIFENQRELFLPEQVGNQTYRACSVLVSFF